MKFCGKCGTELADGAVFCPSCGEKCSVDEGTTVLSQETQFVQQADEGTTILSQGEPFNSTNTYYQPTQPVQQPVQPSYMQQQYSFGQQQQYGQPQYGRPNEPVEKRGLIDAYKYFFQNYVNFSGRTRRNDFWLAYLCNMVIGFIFGMFSGIATNLDLRFFVVVFGVLSFVYSIAILVPSLASIVRRLQDTGKKWTGIFLAFIPIAGPIILLVILAQDSQVGDNEYGPNPKGINQL